MAPTEKDIRFLTLEDVERVDVLALNDTREGDCSIVTVYVPGSGLVTIEVAPGGDYEIAQVTSTDSPPRDGWYHRPDCKCEICRA